MPRNPTPESFRDVVRKRAEMAGMTDEERAEAIGVTRQTLNAWRKSGDLRISQLAKLAKASGQPLALYFDPDPDAKIQPIPIEWDRLTGWLSSIQALVFATEPEVPVESIVHSAAGDTGTSPELDGDGASPDPKPRAPAPSKPSTRPGQ